MTGCAALLIPFCVVTSRVAFAFSKPIPHIRERVSLLTGYFDFVVSIAAARRVGPSKLDRAQFSQHSPTTDPAARSQQ